MKVSDFYSNLNTPQEIRGKYEQVIQNAIDKMLQPQLSVYLQEHSQFVNEWSDICSAGMTNPDVAMALTYRIHWLQLNALELLASAKSILTEISAAAYEASEAKTQDAKRTEAKRVASPVEWIVERLKWHLDIYEQVLPTIRRLAFDGSKMVGATTAPQTPQMHVVRESGRTYQEPVSADDPNDTWGLEELFVDE
jgi:hypothetical protein